MNDACPLLRYQAAVLMKIIQRPVHPPETDAAAPDLILQTGDPLHYFRHNADILFPDQPAHKLLMMQFMQQCANFPSKKDPQLRR